MVWTGKALWTLRMRLGWSTAEMARHLACEPQALRSFEAGEQDPDAEMVQKFSQLKQVVEWNGDEIRKTPVFERELRLRQWEQVSRDDCWLDN